MTLIEVLAAMAILGFVISAILTVRARSLHQYVKARTKLEGISLADELLIQWWQKPQEIPISASGSVPGHENWQWQTVVVNDRIEGLARFQVVRLCMKQTKELATEPPITVDLMLPQTPPPTLRHSAGDRTK